jgi:hypothetical protein
MKLVHLRKLCIKNRYRIHFRLRNGQECIISERGVAEVPALHSIPDFNLEEELGSASEFLLEAAPADEKAKVERPRKLGRGELATMAEGPTAAAAAEHEDE